MLSYGVSNAQEVELFGVARNACVTDDPIGGSLYRIDPENAQATRIGDIGFDGISGLAFIPDGRLVGSARGDIDGQDNAILIDVNVARGTGSLIGLIGDQTEGGCGRAPDLSVDPLTNTLFATGNQCPGSDQYLQMVDPITGQGTLVGVYSNVFSGGGGLAVSGIGEFFVTGEVNSIANIISVDPNTGAPTFIANLNLEEEVFVNSLAFHPITGELFGSTVDLDNPPDERSSTLIKINTVTGVTTKVGDLPDCFDGIIFREVLPSNVPTLSGWGLIATAGLLGIIGFIVIRKRQVTA